MKNYIQRHECLQYLSHEHHYGLLLCGKIREGLNKEIELERIKKYCIWSFNNHLLPHFETEENIIFPILGNHSKLVKKALTDHRKIKRLFEKENYTIKSINLLEEILEKHIRFEEHILFNEIQNKATREEFQKITIKYAFKKIIPKQTEWNDKFWKSN